MARFAPLAAALLGSAAIAAPASAQAPVGGAPAPAIDIVYNTASITAGDLAPATVSVDRAGHVLATGTFDGDPAVGEFGVNSSHLALAGAPTGCWDSFVPQMLPGDVVTVAGEDPVTVPDITAQAPQQVGDTVVVHGTAKGVDPSLLDVQIAPSGAGRFSGMGSAGGQFLSSIGPRGFAATFNMDPAGTGKWTAVFSGLGDQIALASGGTAMIMWDPNALAAVDPPVAFTVDYEAGAVPGPVAGCAGAFSPNEAKGVSRSLINSVNMATDLVVTGVAQPGASASGITLIDSTGRIVTAPAAGAGAWSATVPASTLATLADGPISIGSVFSIGNGATVDGLLIKDATAPAAVTASVASGTYNDAQSIALKAAEGTIYYTLDGSDPTASSKAYSGAIPVGSTQTIKAVAVDKNGNPSQVASFDYTIAPKVVAPVVLAPVVPRLKVESLTLNRHLRLRGARKSGISAIVYAPEGAKVAKFRVLRGKKVVETYMSRISRDGVLEVRLPHSKKSRKALRRGVYVIQIQVGQDASHMGALLKRTIRIS